jgi:NitT/TauT family transport system ATP-binding protein
LSLRLINLSKTFVSSKTGDEVHALKNITYSIENDQFVSIIGPSGCGKTTLLRIIAGLEEASHGKILLDNKQITKPDRHIGLVFQEYALFSWRTVLENIEFGLEIEGVRRRERRDATLRYVKMFELNGFENKYPKELSGGMQQRVAIARTMIVKPKVLLMDEPFGALDSLTRNSLQKFLLDIWEKTKKTIIFVTHNIDEAVFLSDLIIVLSQRPGEIKSIFDNKLRCPRPRDRTSEMHNLVRREIQNLLEKERAIENDQKY